jgi:CheY-like chemotaxis protein
MAEAKGRNSPSPFPLKRAEEERPERSPEWGESQAKEVLVVDDNEAAADSLVRLLNALGFKAHAQYSGEEALVLLQRFRPHFLFLDIGMPGMDGYEVVRQIKERNGTENMRVIALTGYGLTEDKERAMRAGFDHHLTKPIGMKDLQEVMS